MNYAVFLANSDGAVNFPRTDAVLAVANHPHGHKPLAQTDGRVFKDGSHFDTELLPALFALPAFLTGKPVMVFVAA